MYKLLLVLIALVIIGCNNPSSKTNNTTDIKDAGAISDAALDAASVASFLNSDEWVIALPGGWKLTESPDKSIKLFALSNTGNNVFSLEKVLTDASYDKFVIERIRFLRSMEAEIRVTKSVQINGHEFVMVESLLNNLRVWTWITTTKNSVGFVLTCGGLDMESKDNSIICNAVADSFQIKL